MSDEPSPIILTIRGVTKRFAVDDDEVEALAPVDLTIPQGEFVCLIGASGCGKSTLLRIIAGFEEPTTGDALVHGKAIKGPGSDRGMVFQDYALFPWMTVRENIGFGPRQRKLPHNEIQRITTEFVKMVGLERFADRYPSQLSGGMKQRVAIARVLANDANILLMDEPFGALDALTREQLQHELLQICSRTGVTTIFVTHSVEEAVLLADRVLVMSAGPGRIESDFRIKLARPRDVSSPEFNALRRDIARRLTSHLVPSRKRLAVTSSRIPYHDADRRRIKTVAGIVDLGTIGDDEQHVHVRRHIDVISGSRDAVDDRKSSGRVDRHIHEEIQVCDDVALGQSVLRQLQKKIFAAGVLVFCRLPEADCVAFAGATTCRGVVSAA